MKKQRGTLLEWGGDVGGGGSRIYTTQCKLMDACKERYRNIVKSGVGRGRIYTT